MSRPSSQKQQGVAFKASKNVEKEYDLSNQNILTPNDLALITKFF